MAPSRTIIEQSNYIRNDPMAYSNRGNVKRRKRDLEGALADYNHAILLDPKLAMAYNNRGTVELDRKDSAAALADYSRAVELDPKMAEAYLNRGSVEFGKKDDDGAFTDFSRAIELNASSGLGYIGRGDVRRRKGDLDGAISDYTQAIQIDPKNALAYLRRGGARTEKKEYDGAFADYEQTISIDPSKYAAYYERGIAKQIRRDFEGSLLDLTHAAEVTPAGSRRDYLQFFVWLLRARLGRADEANRELAAYMNPERKLSQEPWVVKVGAFLLGNLTEDDLLTAAASPDTAKDQGQHCEAWYYSGMKQLLAGDKKTAADDFNRSLATKQTGYTEYRLAESESEALGTSR
jgi:tetratricopeptide (TPR) repeat protein